MNRYELNCVMKQSKSLNLQLQSKLVLKFVRRSIKLQGKMFGGFSLHHVKFIMIDTDSVKRQKSLTSRMVPYQKVLAKFVVKNMARLLNNENFM